MSATPFHVTSEFWDHATLWSADDESMAGHTTDGGRVFGITRTRYVECDHYGCKAVVVLDPGALVSDEEADERGKAWELVNCLQRIAESDGRTWRARLTERIANEAARQLLRSPKPDEPQGLGAVVQDAAGERWIRAARIAHGWHRPMGTWAKWSDIDAVEVLSEGVTP